MKDLLPDEPLEPTYTPLGVDPVRQSETLRALRALENEGRDAGFRRNELMYAQALSTNVSRPDMARAIGVSRSRVDQLIREHHDLLQARRNAEPAARTAARQMP